MALKKQRNTRSSHNPTLLNHSHQVVSVPVVANKTRQQSPNQARYHSIPERLLNHERDNMTKRMAVITTGETNSTRTGEGMNR